MDSYFDSNEDISWNEITRESNDSQTINKLNQPSEVDNLMENLSKLCSKDFVDQVTNILNEDKSNTTDDLNSSTEKASFEYFKNNSLSSVYPFDGLTESTVDESFESNQSTNYSSDESFKNQTIFSMDDLNESLNLNDTLEEMKRALQSGLNYTMSEPTESPVKVPKPIVNTKSFKNNYDDVKSPVGLYIKNSTATLQKRVNNFPTCMPKSVSSPADRYVYKNEFCGELASVIYKPPKNILLCEDDGPKLPKSIGKYVPMNVKVIKHEGRVISGNKENVEEKLLLDDLTVDDDLLDLTEDYSILASNVAIIH